MTEMSMPASYDRVKIDLRRFDAVRQDLYDAVMDTNEVRRVWLRSGGSLTRAAKTLGVAKQIVDYHVRKANTQSPLKYQSGEPEDQKAMTEYVRQCLEKAGISR